jgi:RimJ/RimL family protein N-acetyltransferase
VRCIEIFLSECFRLRFSSHASICTKFNHIYVAAQHFVVQTEDDSRLFFRRQAMTSNMQLNHETRKSMTILSGKQKQPSIKVRPLCASDKHYVLDAFNKLSDDSRFKRFFGVKKNLSEAELKYFTELDQYNHFALCALELDEQKQEKQIAGIARFIRIPTSPDCAEVGITVLDSVQRRGLGRHLLERLFEAAYQRGIKRLRFECLFENLEMQTLLKKLNDKVRFRRGEDMLTAEILIPKQGSTYSKQDVEDLSALILAFSSQTLNLFTDLSLGVFKTTFEVATQYTLNTSDRFIKWSQPIKLNRSLAKSKSK